MKRGTLNIEALFAVFAATTRARYYVVQSLLFSFALH